MPASARRRPIRPKRTEEVRGDETSGATDRGPRRTLVTGGTGFIGVHLVERLLAAGHDVRVLSRSAPHHAAHRALSRRVDLLDGAGLIRAFADHEPTAVVHLAARTDFFDREDREAWTVNTEGTRNVLRAAASLDPSVRCIFASSIVAHPAGAGTSRVPDEGFGYTGSKVECERIIRADRTFRGPWCIVRPTTVWGPGCGAPFRGFFLAVAAGRYVHPGRSDASKRLSYVGNLCFQLERLLDAPVELIDRAAFHLADYATTTYRAWADAVARQLDVRGPRTLPGPLASTAARCGDLLRIAGWANPPLTSRRLANMRRDTSWIPIDAIREVSGELPFSLDDGVARTVAWLRTEGLVC